MTGEDRPLRVAMLGDYIPRRCGIATFTADLTEALAGELERPADRAPSAARSATPPPWPRQALPTEQPPAPGVTVLAVNDRPEGYDYPARVRFEFPEGDLDSYLQAADFVNIHEFDVVCVQHEYGIFGGPCGSHLLAFMRECRKPIVTTLHTVLRNPSADQRRVLEEIAALSERVVVMADKGVQFLREVYGIPDHKISRIFHGIPDTPFMDPNFLKDHFGVEGRNVLLTFGLLGPGKGIENVIKALPAIVERFPGTMYLILGATHPNVQREQGESYRLGLDRLAADLGVGDNVAFHNRFVDLTELMEFVNAADIYITPYLNEAQITSGTLAYTVGAGKAVVSTPYWHAQELLADGRGVLVPFNDPAAISSAVNELLGNEALRHSMRKKAYQFGRDMIWPNVAKEYVRTFRAAIDDRARRPRTGGDARPAPRRAHEMPLLRLWHLERLTDDTGLIQHAVFTVPRYDDGYTTDDNARGLLLTTMLDQLGREFAPHTEPLAMRYLAFLAHAFNESTGRFRNFQRYDRTWVELQGSEDSHGRALRALGTAAARCQRRGHRDLATRMMSAALPPVASFTSPRAWAFTILGVADYLRAMPGDKGARQLCESLAQRLHALHTGVRSEGWDWFEDRLTYSNAKLSHAMLIAGYVLENESWVRTGLETLMWLSRLQTGEHGQFVPIGSNGFYSRGGARARYAQQPIEAAGTVSACLAAWRISGEDRWLAEARRAFEWFLGRNDVGQPLYDPSTSGCFDGLEVGGVNQNQGAESTLSFLLALVQMRLAEHVLQSSQTGGEAWTVRTAVPRSSSGEPATVQS